MVPALEVLKNQRGVTDNMQANDSMWEVYFKRKRRRQGWRDEG